MRDGTDFPETLSAVYSIVTFARTLAFIFSFPVSTPFLTSILTRLVTILGITPALPLVLLSKSYALISKSTSWK